MMKFKEFIARYNAGILPGDASWRAYDIENMAVKSTLRLALKELGYSCGREPYFAISRVMADYDLDTIERTRRLLELWYVWGSIADGRRTRKLKLRS